jgi:hypothetical protein
MSDVLKTSRRKIYKIYTLQGDIYIIEYFMKNQIHESTNLYYRIYY